MVLLFRRCVPRRDISFLPEVLVLVEICVHDSEVLLPIFHLRAVLVLEFAEELRIAATRA